MQRRKVDFPEPLGPIKATTCPRSTFKETPFRTLLGPKLLCTSETSIIGSLMDIPFQSLFASLPSYTWASQVAGNKIRKYSTAISV